LVIVAIVAVVGVAAGAVALNISSRHRRETQRTTGREQAAQRDLNAIAEALERFKEDVRRYPTNAEGLTCLARKPAALTQDGGDRGSAWLGPYLDNVPEVDPWGNDYVYRTADGGRNFELLSHGPGGESEFDDRFRIRSQVSATTHP
jgi:general secretion pathway protein G